MLSATAVVAAACSGSGFRYITSSDTNTYFKVPEAWTVYDKDDLVAVDEADDESERFRFVAIFDADPSPSIERELQTAKHPFGIARVRELTPQERDTFSLSSLRNEFVSIDRILEEELGELDLLETPRSITREGGLAGARHVYTVTTDEGAWGVDQTGLIDPTTRFVYFLLIGCEAACFEANRSIINEIADSWTIKES